MPSTLTVHLASQQQNLTHQGMTITDMLRCVRYVLEKYSDFSLNIFYYLLLSWLGTGDVTQNDILQWAEESSRTYNQRKQMSEERKVTRIKTEAEIWQQPVLSIFYQMNAVIADVLLQYFRLKELIVFLIL